MTTGRRIIAAVLCCLFLSAVTDLPLYAQQVFSEADYRVGIGDRIFLSVPQRPDLSEWHHLDGTDQQALSSEISTVSTVLADLPEVQKVNVGAYTRGNR